MNTQKTTIALLIVALVMSACGKPAAVSAGSDEKPGADFSSKPSWTEKLGFGHTAKANVSSPATGLILDAIFSRGEIGQLGRYRSVPASVAFITKRDNWSNMIEILDVMGPENVRHEIDMYSMFLKKDAAEKAKYFGDFSQSQREVETLLEKGDSATAQRLIQLQMARLPIAIVFNTFAGWEVDPETTDFFTNKPLVQNARKLHAYLTFLEASADYSSQVLADIAGKISTQVWANPETARVKIRQLWY